MDQRFAQRKKALLAECSLSPDDFAGLCQRLHDFVAPFLDALPRDEQRQHARTYCGGLLSDLRRKNTESIAYRHDQERKNLQHFLGNSAWDHEPLLQELARQVGQRLGQPDAVLTFDPSAFPKKGTDSVGVERQWCGRLGKVENCQVGVYLGYTSAAGHALVDVRLYLPKSWAGDPARRTKCHVPRQLRYRTRGQLALEMLAARGPLLPHRWVTGDDELGRAAWFRRALRERGEQYLLAVPAPTTIRDLEAPPPPYPGFGGVPKTRFQRVDRWCAALPPEAWTTVEVRDGEKGPLTVGIVKRRVQARDEHRRVGPEELLVVIRRTDEAGQTIHDYQLSNASFATPLAELARAAKAQHRVEDSIQRSKGEAGLADYEVRSYAGWYHHQTLSLIATWFLVEEARRGKKNHAGVDGAAGAGGIGAAAACGVRLRPAGAHRRGVPAASGADPVGALLPLQETEASGTLEPQPTADLEQ